MNRECVVLAHTNDESKEVMLLDCIKSLKKFDFKVIVVDHFFVKSACDICDVFIVEGDNPVLTPESYADYGLYHVTVNSLNGYRFTQTINTFAAFSIIELIKAGFKYVTDKALVINYDFELKKDVDQFLESKHDGDFLRYVRDDSLYSSAFFANKRLISLLDTVKSIEDYSKNMKYLEWYFYDLFRDKNISIIDGSIHDFFLPNKFYRSKENYKEVGVFELNKSEVVIKNNDKTIVQEKADFYEIKVDSTIVVIRPSDNHYKYNKAVYVGDTS